MIITVLSDGQQLIDSNYWASDMERKGLAYLSWNAGAARLMVPKFFERWHGDMRSADHVVLSRGSLNYHDDVAMEVMFEDGTDAPLCLIIRSEACDHLVPRSDTGPVAFTVWTEMGRLLALPAWYRVVGALPDKSPLSSQEIRKMKRDAPGNFASRSNGAF